MNSGENLSGNAETSGRLLVSLQVGQPQALETDGAKWRSAIYKTPVAGRVLLGETNLSGDKQANLKYHGGPDKAVCAFPAEHFSQWQAELGLGEEFGYGAFGENFTLSGMDEANVCIGDIYVVGTAKVQVSQPRQPCINLARKWNYSVFPERLVEMGHTGYYLRVLQPGEVGAGDSVILLERPNPEITIQFTNSAKYRKVGGVERARLLAALPELAEEWRRPFRNRKGVLP